MTRLLDTHQHLFYRDHFGYEWSDNLPPLAGRDFTVADYQSLTDGLDVAGTIFMEVDVGPDHYRQETRFVAELAGDPKNRILGIVSSCRPESSEGFDAWLEECADLPVVGFRRILHEVDDEVSRDALFRQNVRKMGEAGFTFDMVYRADQLPVAAELAAACDNTRLILDHCGVPDIAGGEYELWSQRISAIAAYPHVCGKISGVLAYCAQGNATLEAVRPYIDHMINSFGTDRLVWGSDWPVVDLGASLPDWISVFRQSVSGLSPDEAAAISHRSAEKTYSVSL